MFKTSKIGLFLLRGEKKRGSSSTGPTESEWAESENWDYEASTFLHFAFKFNMITHLFLHEPVSLSVRTGARSGRKKIGIE